jgi:hypothetical protein
MKGAFVTFQDYYNRQSVGSSRIRAKSLYKYWPGVDDYQTGEEYDFVIFQKACWIQLADTFKGVKILDLCDPQWQETGRWVEMANLCDAVTLSSEALKEEFQRILPNKRMEVVMDTVDPMACQPQKTSYRGMNKLRTVTWFGWHTAHYLLDQYIPFLKEHEIKLHVISDKEHPKADFNTRYKESTIHKHLVESDACLLPSYTNFDGTCLDFQHLKYKTDNKDILCKALGVPVVKCFADIITLELISKEDVETSCNASMQDVFENRCSQRAIEQFEDLLSDLW